MQPQADAVVACTLAPGVLRERLQSIRRLTDSKLTSHVLDGTRLRLSYRAEAAGDLERIVAAERECCAFLHFTLTSSPDSAELVIDAPDGLDAGARWLFDQFLPQRPLAAVPAPWACVPGTCR